ncbi:MAG: glycosyltransferase family 4 protein [Candidatus Nomurabacteria bacterium]|nr:MAG: glycosyltransferase family 4 protein [Candidatus Nomurabacteria bacterium]
MGLFDEEMAQRQNKTLLITAFFPPKLGGLEHFWSEVTRRWPEDSLIIWTDKEVDANDDNIPHRVIRQKLFAWSWCKPSWLPMLWRLPRYIRRFEIHRILFGHYAQYAILAPLMRLCLGIRYDIMSHGIDAVLPQQNPVHAFFYRLTLRFADTLYANSNQTAKHFGTDPKLQKKIRIAHPGIDFADFPELPQRTSTEGFTVLTISRLVAMKGIDVMLHALALLKAPVRYIVVGDGPEMGALKQLANTLGILEQVHFIGAIPDNAEEKAKWYAQADVFVLPSRPVRGHAESFGIVLLEAARYRLPVIATRQSGAEDIVLPAQSGLLVDPGNPEELARAIKELMGDQTWAQQLGEKHYTRVQTEFTWKRTMEELLHE